MQTTDIIWVTFTIYIIYMAVIGYHSFYLSGTHIYYQIVIHSVNQIKIHRDLVAIID